jgi:hypothetical protein
MQKNGLFIFVIVICLERITIKRNLSFRNKPNIYKDYLIYWRVTRVENVG